MSDMRTTAGLQRMGRCIVRRRHVAWKVVRLDMQYDNCKKKVCCPRRSDRDGASIGIG